MLGSVGLFMGGVVKAVEVEMVRQVAPMIQSIVLLVFTVGLPIFLSLGSYSLSTLMSLSILQFSIIFWGFLFALASWLDNFMLSGLWSGADKNASVLIDTVLPSSNGLGTQLLAITWVTWAVYTLAPLVFTYCLGVVGMRAGAAVAQAINDGGNMAGNAAGKGVGMAKAVLTKGKG